MFHTWYPHAGLKAFRIGHEENDQGKKSCQLHCRQLLASQRHLTSFHSDCSANNPSSSACYHTLKLRCLIATPHNTDYSKWTGCGPCSGAVVRPRLGCQDRTPCRHCLDSRRMEEDQRLSIGSISASMRVPLPPQTSMSGTSASPRSPTSYLGSNPK